MQVFSWKKIAHIPHNSYTDLPRTVRILVYLSKSPLLPAEGDKMLPEPSSGLATLLNNRNITLSHLQKNSLQNQDILQEASLPCLSSSSPPSTPNKNHAISFNYIKFHSFISFKYKNSPCKSASLAFWLCLYLSQQLQPCSNTKMWVSNKLLPLRCRSR